MLSDSLFSTIFIRRERVILVSGFFLLLLWTDFQIHFFLWRPQTVALSKISALLGGCQTSVAPGRAGGERREEEDRGRDRKRGRREEK